MRLSVFIVTCRRLIWLQPCVTSVLAALPPDAELVLLLNGSDAETTAWVRAQTDSRLRWFSVSPEPRAQARNRAFELCRAEIIHWLDDDVVVPHSLFRALLGRFEKNPGLTVVGGPNVTPEDSRFREKLFGAVMTSRFAAPFVFARYAADRRVERSVNEHHLILCNLALRRTEATRTLRFRANLRSNEENLFLFECTQRGIKMAFAPEVFVYHRRRATLRAFWSQTSSYGHGRAQQFWLEPKSCHPMFFVPAAVWVALVAALWQPDPGLLIVAGLALMHVGLSLWGALDSATVRRLGPLAILAMVPLTASVHLTYGLGLWRGMIFGWVPVTDPANSLEFFSRRVAER